MGLGDNPLDPPLEDIMKIDLAKKVAKQMIEQPHLFPFQYCFYKVGGEFMINRADAFSNVQPRYKVKVYGPWTPQEILDI